MVSSELSSIQVVPHPLPGADRSLIISHLDLSTRFMNMSTERITYEKIRKVPEVDACQVIFGILE